MKQNIPIDITISPNNPKLFDLLEFYEQVANRKLAEGYNFNNVTRMVVRAYVTEDDAVYAKLKWGDYIDLDVDTELDDTRRMIIETFTEPTE